MEWSSDRQATAQNQLIDICRDSESGLELLGQVPTAPEHFEEKMDTAAFTHRSDAKAVVHLQEKIFLEKVRRNESLNLEGLPRSEFQRLLNALPYFEVLQSITLQHFECSQEEAEAFAKVGFWNLLAVYPPFQVAWFKASNSLPSIDPTFVDMWPCTTLVFAHHAHLNPKGCRKILGIGLHLNPPSPRDPSPTARPVCPLQALRETKVLKFQCRAHKKYEKSFNHMIQAGRGTFPGPSFACIYICLIFCHVGASSSSSSSSSSPSSSIYCTLSRFFRVTFLGVLSDLFRGQVTSIWGIKRALGRSWVLYIGSKVLYNGGMAWGRFLNVDLIYNI